MSETLERLTYWRDSGATPPIAAGDDCDEPIEVTARATAAIAVEEMRRNPYVVYCRRRGCGHLGTAHEAAGCTAEGCDCEALRE